MVKHARAGLVLPAAAEGVLWCGWSARQLKVSTESVRDVSEGQRYLFSRVQTFAPWPCDV